MGLPVMPYDLLQQRKQYRAPFKIQFVEWNPCSDLLALASRKGEVMVKRNAWKRCWKLNVSELTAFPETQCLKPACVESIAWSPDGAVLAVAMNDGHLHLIEGEHGVVGWSRKLGPSTCAKRMRWFWSGEGHPETKAGAGKDSNFKVEDEVKAVASIFTNGEDVIDERLGKADLRETLYSKSLQGTILFMIRDDLVVLILAGALLPVSEIRLAEKLVHLKLDVINVYDVLYTKESGLTLAITDYGPCPKLDDIDRDTICTRSSTRLSGEYVTDPFRSESINAERNFGIPSLVPNATTCPHSHLINIDFKLENENLLWEILLRYLKMFTCLMHFTYSMELAHKDWESESKIFANRLNSSRDFRLGDALLNMLLGGAPGPLAERWLERSLGAAGIHSMREFVEKRFSGLVSMLRGQLSAAARALAFQMDQYCELIRELQEEKTDYESMSLPSWSGTNIVSVSERTEQSLSPSQIPDVDANCVFDAMNSNQYNEILMRLHEDGIRIQAKCQEVTIAATNNLSELSQLVRWMSSLAPLLKSSKRSAQIMENNGNWDVASLLEYIIQTFVTEADERERLRKCVFNIEEILKEMRFEEAKEDFNEEKLMNDSPGGDSAMRELDNRSLGELLSAGRKDTVPGIATSLGETSADNAAPHANPSQQQSHHEFVLDKVNAFWTEKLDEQTLRLLGERFALDGVNKVVESSERSLVVVLREVTQIVQAASLLIIQDNTSLSIRWIYELASGASHCGFDSVRLSKFRWSSPTYVDGYERKLHESKGKDIEIAICVSAVGRDGVRCEYLLPHSKGKLKAGVQADMSILVAMQSGGFVVTTPVQSEPTQKMDWQSEGRLQLVTDENAVFGNIIKFISVEIHSGGHVYVLATFKSEAGETNRLMRKHPNLEAWYVHNGSMLETSPSAFLSTNHQQGCIVSEEGSRVILFRTHNSYAHEQLASLLVDAPIHRPALQLLSFTVR
ncbi:hypothetical protein KIN20_012992 [Parelaphostrongylus tenuis]|uniref:Anaphase-promoting complex subunit 4-like WD40 domain-containing protein n=1 Tax=Parelaphostrongylus tenuis TaxID=148309 RepID=A0AAD5MBH3_PARTN|nr:hypothetical protein KIN20_012992 [Parelaphostrongylus tenuis]